MDPKQNNDNHTFPMRYAMAEEKLGAGKRCRLPHNSRLVTRGGFWWMLRKSMIREQDTNVSEEEDSAQSSRLPQNARSFERSGRWYRERIYENKCHLPTKMRGPHRRGGCHKKLPGSANNPSTKQLNAYCAAKEQEEGGGKWSMHI